MGRLLLLLSKAGQHLRQFRKVPHRQERQDVRLVLVPALPGTERNVWLCIPVRELCRVRRERQARRNRGVQAGRNQELPHLAVLRWLARRRGAATRNTKWKDRMQASMTLRRRLMAAITLVAIAGIAVSS